MFFGILTPYIVKFSGESASVATATATSVATVVVHITSVESAMQTHKGASEHTKRLKDDCK